MTGVVVDRLPPGREFVETDEVRLALAVDLDTIDRAQWMDRACVRQQALEDFDTRRIIEIVVATLANMGERIEALLAR